MARWGKCDFRELEQLNKRLEQLSSVDFGVLHFMVNFNLPLIRPYDETYMETLETDVGTMGGG